MSSTLFMLRLGVVGALIGVLVGELMDVVGIAGLSYREVRRDDAVGSADMDVRPSDVMTRGHRNSVLVLSEALS